MSPELVTLAVIAKLEAAGIEELRLIEFHVTRLAPKADDDKVIAIAKIPTTRVSQQIR